MFKTSSLYAYVALFLFAACSKNQVPDIQELSKSHPIQAIQDEGEFNCTYGYSGSELQTLHFDNGNDYLVQSTDKKIIQLNAGNVHIINCEYDGQDRLTGYENLDEYQGLKQTFQLKYATGDHPNFVQCMQGTRDQYNKWSYQILYTLEDIVHNSKGAIESARFVIYLNSRPIDHYDLSFETSNDANPLYMNTSYLTSPEFSDFGYNLTKMSTRNVTRMHAAHSSNASFNYEVRYAYQLNAEGLPQQIAIAHPSVSRVRNLSW